MTTDLTQQERRNQVEISLDLEGMTCAACANRIEKKLNKVDGVTATVNYATERAQVLAPRGVTVQDLIQVVQAAGYDARPTAEEPREERAEVLWPRLRLAFLLAVPVIAVSMVPAWQFPAWQWVALAMTCVVVLWCGRSFHAATWKNLRHGTTTMDTLVSLGTLVALGWSVIAMTIGHAGTIGMKHGFSLTLGHSDPLGNIYLEAAAGIVAFLLLGRWIEARSKREAGAAVRALMEVAAKEATVLRDGVETTVPADRLAVGDVVVVRPGEKVATDGEVIDGASAVDASIITGESLPVEVGVGAHVVGGSVNTTGRLLVRATAVGSATQVAQIARMVEQAQTGKAEAQRLADRITEFFVPGVLLVALLTCIGQLLAGAGFTYALTAAIAVLIIACPCALGLATPSALLVGTGRGAELGIIIRGAQALEKARAVQTIVLDKTGTLTTGVMTVLAVEPAPGHTREELLRLAGAVESGSEHPIARAVVAAAGEALPAATNFEALPGRGVVAEVEGRPVHAGSRRLLADLQVTAPERCGPVGSEVLVVADGALIGRIVVGDSLKPGAEEAVTQLRGLGLEPVLLTGDAREVADEVAAAVGITHVHAEVLPEGKVQVIRDLQAEGRRVAMVGDGVNDAAALATSDLGIAMGAGTDAAAAASDLTLVRDDLVGVVDAVRLSRATDRTIRGNLLWAFAYNVAAIPIAALGWLTPMIAGAAMACSSVFVVLNSLRLRTFRSAKLG
ncbi:MAG: heavy metal translocating P-type ATPase [Arachnia propionica]|uniref:heavy metal translocating P-type ATPase n=1 Tax=Arachnia propionica TaxID=1750 RepID=UPI00270AEDC5|nr:heavy metal translocating P-type ATPase [Arachnia propionica]